MTGLTYPWYQAVSGDDLEQGDLIEACPVFLPPDDLDAASAAVTTFNWEERDVVVMTQTCDLAKGREKVTEVLLCPIWQRSELTEGYLATSKGLEDTRRGNLPGFHLVAACALAGWERDVRVVDFRRVYSLPVGFFAGKPVAPTDCACCRRIENTWRKRSPASSCGSACQLTSHRSADGQDGQAVARLRGDNDGRGVLMKVRELLKRLHFDGWRFVRQKGSHRHFHHDSKPGTVTVPGKPNDDLHPKTAATILRSAQLED